MSLKIENLSKSFLQGDDQIHVLQNLNLSLKTGELAAIVGQSGSGKSTFLSLVAGLEKADTGKIIIEGTDICPLDERDLTHFRAASISIVFQQYHLVSHLTAFENVLLPLEILRIENPEPRVHQILDEMGLGHRMNHRPTQLSGGECQRVAIARALVVRPKLLLADEPSGNLDFETGQKVMGIFFKMIKQYGTTTLLVTHSEPLSQMCPRILKLKSGNLTESLRTGSNP